MPGERDVFDPLLAAVVNQRERQSVFDRTAKLINARAAAAFRSVAASFLDGHSIAGYCNIAPNMAFGTDDIEGIVAFDRPDSAKRVCPNTDERSSTNLWRSSAPIH